MREMTTGACLILKTGSVAARHEREAMNLHGRAARLSFLQFTIVVAGTLLWANSALVAQNPIAPDSGGQSKRDSGPSKAICEPSEQDSPYIPVDSWVYPAVLRLYSMGYTDNVFLGMRPWTRASLSDMLD